MKNKIFALLIIVSCLGCKKSKHPSFAFDGTVVAYAPTPVTKSVNKRVFAHILPWFETPASLGSPGDWGEHWTMNLGSNYPETFVNGQRRIASKYNPLIGPYASGDTAVIDYQLLLMKLSGIDGVFIDWPGVGTNLGQNLDLPMAKHNTDVIVSRLARVGLKYAVVYEDNDLNAINNDSSLYVHAQADMNYLQTNYFSDPDYEYISNQPLLLDFGPQAKPLLNNVSDTFKWRNIFSVLSPKPAFITLANHSDLAGANAAGEFTWVFSNGVASLNSFYDPSYNPGIKISAAYPGYNSFYAQGNPGGTPGGPTWVITPTVSLFKQTLDLAIQQTNNQYIQLVTWNDYGEGTIIEPTVQFGYGYLTTLQSDLQVSSLSQSDLQAVAQLYQLRQSNAGNPAAMAKLDQGFYFMASLQMDSAKALLASF
jgi:hypothetical protein